MSSAADHLFERIRRARFTAVVAAVFGAAVCACGGEDVVTTAPTPCTPVAMTYPGSVHGTISSSGCTSGGFLGALYRFTADSAGGHRFIATSSFSGLAIEVMTDPPGSHVVYASKHPSINADWLLPAGTYLLRITARTTGSEGPFALSGASVPLNASGCRVRTLVVGMTLQDQALVPTDCPYEGEDGTFYDAYGISSAKPCTIRMSSAAMDSFLWIRNAMNTGLLTYNDDEFEGSDDAFVSLAACNNNGGPIVIVANAFSALAATGTYTLTVTLEGGGSVVANAHAAVPMSAEIRTQSTTPTGLTRAKPATRRR